MENLLYQKALKEFKDRNLERSLQLFNKAIQQEPNNPDIYSDRGVLFYHLNDKIKALEDMNTSMSLDPEYSYRYSSRAYIKDWMGDTLGAVEDYKEAVRLDPQDAVAYNNLGLMEEKLGHKTKAKERFERADKLAAMEKTLMNKLDELESVEEIPLRETEESSPQRGKVIKNVLTKRSSFKEFVSFVKNGFKIK